MARHYAKGKLGAAYYDGMEARRDQERMDSSMIMEDHSAIANLPQNVMIKDWPEGGYYIPDQLNDDISGVNRQMDMDGRDVKKHLVPKKV